jgi:Ca-activated chloride channel homolog
MTILPILLALSVGAALAAAPSPGAAPQQGPPGRPYLKSSIDLVTVTASVTDEQGRPVKGLPRDAFTVFEDGVEQPLAQFDNARVPVSLGILLDVSESMAGRRMAEARFALERFVVDLLQRDDEAFLMVFNHRPRVLAGWTIPPSQLEGRLEGVIPSGGTAIYDAVMAAIPRFRTSTHQRSAIVLISDGADTASDAALREVRTALRREQVFVYAVAIDAPGKRPVSGQVQPYALREITDDSGGYTEVVSDSSELVPATARIADELNSQYLLGYVPPKESDAAYRAIRVRMRDSSLNVRARRGYLAAERLTR